MLCTACCSCRVAAEPPDSASGRPPLSPLPPRPHHRLLGGWLRPTSTPTSCTPTATRGAWPGPGGWGGWWSTCSSTCPTCSACRRSTTGTSCGQRCSRSGASTCGRACSAPLGRQNPGQGCWCPSGPSGFGGGGGGQELVEFTAWAGGAPCAVQAGACVSHAAAPCGTCITCIMRS